MQPKTKFSVRLSINETIIELVWQEGQLSWKGPSSPFLLQLKEHLTFHSHITSTELETFLLKSGASEIEIIEDMLGRRIDDEMSNEVIKNNFCGSIRIQHKNHILLKKGYGFKDVARKQNNTSDTIFPIASITKSFTAFLILKLQEKGLISIQDSLNRFFPNEALKSSLWRKISIEMLINHTSGLPNIKELRPIFSPCIFETYHSLEELKRIIGHQSLLFEPGTKFHYSNLGYLLLSMIIETVSSFDFNDALSEWILKPLHLKHTLSPIELYEMKNVAVPHLQDNRPAPILHPSILVGAGNLISSLDDLNLWIHRRKDPSLLRTESIRTMTTPVPKRVWLNSEKEIFYAFGTMFDMMEGYPLELYAGNMLGMRSLILHFPDDDLILIVLSNKDISPKPKEYILELMKKLASRILLIRGESKFRERHHAI